MTSPTTKPALLPLDVAQIPADLTALPQWVLWKLEWDHGRNAWTKVPYAPNGAHASTNRRATWSPFDAAVAAYGQGGNFHGIGFVLDGQSDLVGFDLDKLKEHVHQSAVGEIYRVLQASGTYIERSPSGKGLRAFLRGKLPFSGKNCRTLGVEVYRADRYLTITGHWLKDTGAAIVADQQAIDDIVGLAFPPMPPAPALAQTTAPISQGLSDADILNRAAAAKNGKDFNLLWAGDCRAYFLHRKLPVASQSEADLALCQILAFWSGRNAAQMDRLFRQSELMRPKWDALRGTQTYGQMTITQAITGCQNVYSGQPSGASSTLQIIDMATVQQVPLEWLWPGFFPLGKVSIVSGNPGLGKSQVTLDIASRVSTGAPWPTGELGTVGRVILISAEDDVADTIAPRLVAAGADLSKIVQVASVDERDDKGRMRNRSPTLERDIEQLGDHLRANPGTRLCVIDPVSAYLGKTDSNNNSEVRGLLDPLGKLAQEHQVAILLVSHLNKGSGNALYRTAGSIGFVAAARAAFVIGKDESAPLHRYMLPVKNNLAPDSKGIGYEVKQAANGAPHVIWDKNTVTGEDLESMLQQSAPGEGDRVAEAMRWLTGELATGPVPAAQMTRAAKKDGISERTLDRAKSKLKVKSLRNGTAWTWALP